MQYPKTCRISELKYEIKTELNFQGERKVKSNLIGLAVVHNSALFLDRLLKLNGRERGSLNPDLLNIDERAIEEFERKDSLRKGPRNWKYKNYTPVQLAVVTNPKPRGML